MSKVKKQPVEFFTTPDNLAQNIASSVGHYLSEHPNSQIPILEHPKPIGNTLPTQPYFFGRVRELEIISSALSQGSRTWGALIDGPGSIGKTALAIKVAHNAPAELFEHKIFIPVCSPRRKRWQRSKNSLVEYEGIETNSNLKTNYSLRTGGFVTAPAVGAGVCSQCALATQLPGIKIS